MAVDTPATIAILGAGPMGLEVGLYARYLGYDVVIFEQREVAAHVRDWGHVRMFSPFAELRSTLGVAALKAQDPDYHPPELDARLTGHQWCDRYLLPLSQTDLIADHIRTRTRVLTVSRRHLLKHDPADAADRAADRFRILVERDDAPLDHVAADIVVDCTGVYGQPLSCGAGGVAARGEAAVRSRIEYGVPDVLGTQRALYAGRRVLVVGAGMSAAATVVALTKLAQRTAQTRVTWSVHRRSDECSASPLDVADDDPLPERQRLVRAVNALAAPGASEVDFRPGTVIDAVEFDESAEEFRVWFAGQAELERFDRLVVAVGYRPDRSLYEELRVVDSPRTGGPLGVAERLLRAADAERAGTRPLPAAHLVTPEPNFYVLGAKSYGRDPGFLMTGGYRQIRDLFAMIGGRAGLDLYAAATGLAR
ncbi:MAG: hypothetical protein MUF48_08735 [Pirellulaceae bacterium]|jgi:thioredoxin reductase|nr:hypothetical protein [Pirellulaceae bacterium]